MSIICSYPLSVYAFFSQYDIPSPCRMAYEKSVATKYTWNFISTSSASGSLKRLSAQTSLTREYFWRTPFFCSSSFLCAHYQMNAALKKKDFRKITSWTSTLTVVEYSSAIFKHFLRVLILLNGFSHFLLRYFSRSVLEVKKLSFFCSWLLVEFSQTIGILSMLRPSANTTGRDVRCG